MSTYYLAHHGIENMRWGVRNGPPYPLSQSKHNAVVRAKSSDYGSTEESVDKEKTSKHTNVSEYVSKRVTGINPNYSKTNTAYNENCKEVALTAAYNLTKDKHDIAPPRLFNGTIHDVLGNEFGYSESQIDKICKDVSVTKETAKERVTNNILKYWGDDGNVGILGLKLRYNENDKAHKELVKVFQLDNNKPDGHVFNWVIENGEVKFFDAQENICKDASDYFDKVIDESDIEVMYFNKIQNESKSLKHSSIDSRNLRILYYRKGNRRYKIYA